MNQRDADASARPLRLLLVEDDASDAGLLERRLRQGGFAPQARRVCSGQALRAALADGPWDLVLSDYRMPGLDALDALEAVRERDPDLPFIVVSGQIGEEAAVELMRHGANDFLMKDRLARLLPAIERELQEAARHREQRRLDAALQAQAQMVQRALRASGDGAWDWNPQTGEAHLSDEWKGILGYAPHEFPDDMGEWLARVHPQDLAGVERDIAAYYAGETPIYRSEHRLRCKDGSWRWVLDRGVVIEWDAAGRPVREVGTLSDISAAKAAELALRESHAVLHKLARQAPGVLYQFQLHADGRMSMPFVSEAAIEQWRLTPEQLRGDAAAAFAMVHPADIESMMASIAASAAGLRPWSLVYRADIPGRGLRWLHGEAQPERLADGSVLWHGFIRDVTEQRQADAELRLLQACIEHVNDAVVVTDAESQDPPGPRIVYVNPAFEKQTGWSAAEALGRTPRMLQGPASDRAELARIGLALRARQPVRAEVLNYRRDGRSFWSEIDITPVADEHGAYTHWVSVQRDTSARKEAEQERERLIRELEARNRELDAFNHSVAHDLRNPIISIRGMADVADLAVAAGDVGRARDCLARVARSAEQADTLIRNLMELAKLGKRAIRLLELPARAALEQVRSAFEVQIQASCAQVHIEAEADLRLLADPALLQMIVGNLLGNALRHRDPHRLPQIWMRARAAPEAGVCIEVSDNGRGIEAELHGRVFRLFERFGCDSDGTGVGLALVERAARLLDGYARLARSAPGEGSSFEVWLPAPSAATPAPAAEPASARRAP